jgi:hypothetical protein
MPDLLSLRTGLTLNISKKKVNDIHDIEK